MSFPTRRGVTSLTTGSSTGASTVGVAEGEGGSRWERQLSGSSPRHPDNKGQSQVDGGWAVGLPRGPLAPAVGCLSLCQDPVECTRGLRLGRGSSLLGAPKGCSTQ